MKILEEIREIFNLILEHSDDVARIRFDARMKNGATIRYNFDRQKWEREQQREYLPKRETNQLINAILDVIGIAAGISILVVLVVYAGIKGDTPEVLQYSISGALLILYFLFSALYNFLSPAHTAREFFFRFRGILLFLTLTGFYLPFYLIYMPANTGAVFMGFVLLFCVAGLYFFGLNTAGSKKVATGSGILLAWTSIAALPFMSSVFNLFESTLIVLVALLLNFWVAAAMRGNHETAKEPPATNLFLLFASLCLFWLSLLWLNM